MLECSLISSEFNDILVEKFPEMALDDHGSFVLQKYLRVCSQEVINKLKPTIVELSPQLAKNPHLSKPVQIFFFRLDAGQVSVYPIKQGANIRARLSKCSRTLKFHSRKYYSATMGTIYSRS